MYPMSATQIGRKIGGLGAAETNLLLKERGFLEGEACDYWPTEKGKEYTTIESFHAGTGGYAQYNRYWTTIKYNPEILDAIGEVSPEDKVRLSEAVREHRKAAHERNFGIDTEDPIETLPVEESEPEGGENPVADAIGAAVLTIAAVYLAKKVYDVAAPKARSWWTNKVAPKLEILKKRKGEDAETEPSPNEIED